MKIENKEFQDRIEPLVSEHKKELFNKVLDQRTRHITVVIEDVFQSQNASAVLRSCDCFGIQDIHIIENRNEYDINPLVALGSTKWLTMQKYNEKTYNTVECINSLKEKGYTIVATSPHEEDILLDELPLDKPIALLFGTEAEGLTDKALEMADVHMKIPMYGFTESFNISVSAAMCIHTLTEKLRKSDVKWQLPQREKDELYFEWLKKVVKKVEFHENELKKNHPKRS